MSIIRDQHWPVPLDVNVNRAAVCPDCARDYCAELCLLEKMAHYQRGASE